ncbi:hypothetical protein [Saccharicrinis aurantiacus]|uniref:hypothetical protein n=1 Tax=Saccharicrinis aurantiacus TaxID=1849719 RepID=UPI00249109B2|nr:hypothetical protein [Saccharicrinis aurantiacus]
MIIGRQECEFDLNEKSKIVVRTGGIFSCGESITITQSCFGFFNKEIFNLDNLCLIGIYNIETVILDESFANILIYHNGENDSENPYKYKVERKNVW